MNLKQIVKTYLNASQTTHCTVLIWIQKFNHNKVCQEFLIRPDLQLR